MPIDTIEALQAAALAADAQLKDLEPGRSYYLDPRPTRVTNEQMLQVEALLQHSRWKREIDGTTILRVGNAAWLIRNS
jgi:hypothetical protein